MIKRLLLIIFSAFLFSHQLVGQNSRRESFIKDSLDAYVNQALTKWRIPGAAVCIIKDGKVVLMKGYGVKEVGKPDKVDENTLFMIGSNTKAMTAIALAMLQEDNKLSLDDQVTKYLSEFKLNNKLAGEQATIRDLLCHRLGFGTFQGDFTYWTSNVTRQEVIQKMSLVKALYPFRTTWGYNNAAFLTAGQIIPKVTGRPWEVFMQERLFKPLGMTRTLALSKDLPTATNKAAAHTIAEGKLIKIPYCVIDNISPAGSVSSSVNDMSKWVLALLNKGKVGEQEVISSRAIATTIQPQSIVGNAYHPTGPNYELYGLGWFLQDYLGKRMFMHTGGVNGFVTSVTAVPGENLGIIVLTNTDHNNFYDAVKWEIVDAYLKQPYRGYSDISLANTSKNEATAQAKDKLIRDSVALNLPTLLPLKAYTGNFTNELYGKATISPGKGKELKMHFEHHPNLVATLKPINGHRFYVKFSDPMFGQSAVFPFLVQDGKVNGVRVKVADFVEYTPYIFTRVP